MDCNEGKERCSCNSTFTCIEVLRDDFDEYLDAGASRPGDEGFEADRISWPDRQKEVYRISGGGYHIRTAVAHGRDRGNFINCAHQFAAEQCFVVVNIIREDTASFEYAGFVAVFRGRYNLRFVFLIHFSNSLCEQYVNIHDNRKAITVQ